jgi:predicted PurR-regulated permease PerM
MLTFLVFLLVSVLLIGCLYLSQDILVPIAVAVFLTFLLSPLVSGLEYIGLPRTPAVVVAVSCAVLAVIGIVWLLTAQVQILVTELPNYTKNLKEKVHALRAMNQSFATDRLEEMVQELTGDSGSAGATARSAERPTHVIVEGNRPWWITWTLS